MMKIYLYNHQ